MIHTSIEGWSRSYYSEVIKHQRKLLAVLGVSADGPLKGQLGTRTLRAIASSSRSGFPAVKATLAPMTGRNLAL